jgi:4-hydroxybenzoate polyprenyltransferase
VAVTVFVIALALKVGDPAGTTALLAAAVLAGQLSIGWSNDRLDVELDRRAQRTDKPLLAAGSPDAGVPGAGSPAVVSLGVVSLGVVSLAVVDRAIGVALAACLGASLALGWAAGLLHLFAVACGWVYNLVGKATPLSWLPYALAFGSLPAIATLARPDPEGPAWWAVAAGALLGVTAHLANALPDLRTDREAGVIGFPHRIGARGSVLLAAAGALAGSAVLVLGPAGSGGAESVGPGSVGPARFAGLVAAALLTLVGAVQAIRRPSARWPFYGVVAVVALDIVLLVTGPPF